MVFVRIEVKPLFEVENLSVEVFVGVFVDGVTVMEVL